MNDLMTMDLLPNDEETAQWFEDNIGIVNDCSASSAIYKFRLWLKDRQQYGDQQAKKEAIGFYNFCQNQILIRKTYESFNEWAKANDEKKYKLYIQSKQQ